MKLPIVKHILVFTTWGQKCPHSEPEQFTFDNFQSNHPVREKTFFTIHALKALKFNVSPFMAFKVQGDKIESC